MEKIKRTIGFILSHPLGKRHPFKSIFRFLLWQFQSNITPSKFIVKEYLEGVKFYARKGLTGITGNIYSGLHEFNDMAFLLHLLNKNDIFFDIGANAGSYTLLASGVCGAKSIAIEPIPSTFRVLKKNIELNALFNKVSLINSGAGSEEGMAVFSSDNDTTNHVIKGEINNAAHSLKVPVIAIDSLLNKAMPILIKIDVEGYETEVLKGMEQTLLSPALKAIIIELNGSGERYGFDEQEIHKLLLENGFNLFSYDPFKRLLEVAEETSDFNNIYCRDLEFINARIKNAAGVKIMGEVI